MANHSTYSFSKRKKEQDRKKKQDEKRAAQQQKAYAVKHGEEQNPEQNVEDEGSEKSVQDQDPAK